MLCCHEVYLAFVLYVDTEIKLGGELKTCERLAFIFHLTLRIMVSHEEELLLYCVHVLAPKTQL